MIISTTQLSFSLKNQEVTFVGLYQTNKMFDGLCVGRQGMSATLLYFIHNGYQFTFTHFIKQM